MPKFTIAGDDPDRIEDAEAKAGGKLAANEGNSPASFDHRSSVPPIPYEAKCSVCNSPYRKFIDAMLAQTGANYTSIAERVPGHEGRKLDRRAVANHAKKHLGFIDDAMRAILEKEADEIGQDYEHAVQGAITHRGVLEVLVRKAYSDLVSGNVDIEIKDMLQAINALQAMDEKTASVQVDYMRAQANALVRAVQEVVDDIEVHNEIVQRMKAIMARDGYLSPDVQEAQVVDAELPPPH